MAGSVMTSIDRKPETDAFLASKQATWAGFVRLSVIGSAVVILILVALALIFVV